MALNQARHTSDSRAIVWYVEHSYTPCSFQLMHKGEERKEKENNKLENFMFAWFSQPLQKLAELWKYILSVSVSHPSALVFMELFMYLVLLPWHMQVPEWFFFCPSFKGAPY